MNPSLAIPQCPDEERAVLGSLIQYPQEACPVAFNILTKPEAFYLHAHQHVYSAIRTLFGKASGIDMLAVGDELRRMGRLEEIGSMYLLSQLTGEACSPALVERHCRIVIEYALRRQIIHSGEGIALKAFSAENDVFELLDEEAQKIHDIRASLMRRGFSALGPEAQSVFDALSKSRTEGKRGVTGIPSGYKDLDNLTAGWQKSDLIILAARPSIGKTALAMSMGYNAVQGGQPVGVFSLEMSKEQLALRLLCAEAKVDIQKVRTGYCTDKEWAQMAIAARTLAGAKLFIDDTPAIPLMELRAKALRMVEEHGVAMIIVDYLQIMCNPAVKESREREIASISRGLKTLAKDLHIPIIALAQLNRNSELRTGERAKPMLADLRESGSIEQDADIVLLIHRNKDQDCPPEEKDRAEIIVAKQRNGMTGSVILKWIPYYARFESLEIRFPEGAIPPPVDNPHF